MSELESIIDKDDKIVLIVHRHWLSLVFPLLSSVIVSIIGAGGIYLIARFPERIEAIGPVPMFMLAAVTLIVLGVILFIANLNIYRQNGIVLTDTTMYYSSQIGLINQTVSRFSYEQLEEVAFTQKGLLSTLLDYGDLIVKTAAEKENMVFTWAPHPKTLAEAVLEQQKLHEANEHNPA